MGIVILVVIVVGCILLLSYKNRKPTEDQLEKQKNDYEEILKKYEVPKEHYEIVVGQSKVYNIYNCPAVIWKEEEVVKTLFLRAVGKPILSVQEEEDFLFLASQPYIDFLRFDGTEYPDWAVQPAYIKEKFLPYVDLSTSKGGIDYKRNMYWAGTICVYPTSMAQVFKMLKRPLADFDNKVDQKKLMVTDGSLPQDMLEEWRKTKEGRKAEAAAFLSRKEKMDQGTMEGMEKAIQTIRDTERKAGEEAINALYAKLLSEKRFEDLEKATQDEEYRKQLMQELL
ncbi:MAG: hypothetical protein IKW28_04900 [Lachnospiraceae bacterium]|nr:hypothetical protein [Lachnospiraceae bacterium]